MRHAFRCGYPHVDHLLRTINSRQYSELIAFLEAEPFGDERIDIGFARLCELYANCHLKPDAEPLTLDKFIKDWWEPRSAKERPDAQSELAAVDQEWLAVKVGIMFAGLGWQPPGLVN
jgi:hypothetical protein